MTDKRQIVFEKSSGHCWYCGENLDGKKWHIDHVEPVRRTGLKKLAGNPTMEKPENDTFENMVPACVPCNLFKSVYSLEEFREQLAKQIERARKSSVNFRNAERFRLIEVQNKPVVFWFEKEKLHGR